MIQTLKQAMVGLGPRHPAVRLALQAATLCRGFRVSFRDGRIAVGKRHRRIELAESAFVLVPFVQRYFATFFETIAATQDGATSTLDFSRPRLHRYLRHDVGLFATSIPEEDVIDGYTFRHLPQPGDTVFDGGAHAGASAYFLAQLVGPAGKVYAFEPDDLSYEYLLRNIELHGLTQVVPVKKALAACDAVDVNAQLAHALCQGFSRIRTAGLEVNGTDSSK